MNFTILVSLERNDILSQIQLIKIINLYTSLFIKGWKEAFSLKTSLKWLSINHFAFLSWIALFIVFRYISSLNFESLYFLIYIKNLSILLIIIHFLIKLPLVLKIYYSNINIDKWFKFWFSIEGLFSPFGLVIMKYILFSPKIQVWEAESENNWFFLSKTYLKNVFPAIKIKGNRLLVVSNLSFSYIGLPSFLMKIYKYFSKRELISKEIEKYLSNRDDKRLIKNINLSLASGRFIAIVGKNGSGKSTIAKIIVHLLSNYDGQVLWAGKELQEISIKSFARNVAYIPQHSIIYHDISLFDFVAIGFSPREGLLLNKIDENQKKREILKILEELNLSSESQKTLYSLSGGNKQKAIIARSIIQGAKIIVLDEPLNFLDVKSKILVLKYLKTLQKKYGVTIIMIHHDIEEIKRYIDEIVVVDNGFLDKHIKLDNLIEKIEESRF